MRPLRPSAWVAAAWASLLLAACGGGGGGGGLAPTPAPASNVLAVVIDAGPLPSTNPTANTLYTTVTVCVPGSTTQCQTIDHIQVDTGSQGLRVLSSVLTLALPTTMASDGNTLVECTQFVDGYSWGPVSLADLQIAGETANSVPVQVIGTSAFPAIPTACSGTGTAEDTVATFGANGILGIGVFPTDCATGICSAGSGFYYSCTMAACAAIAVSQASQVQNPIPLFAKDNNGSIIELPSVSAPGATSLAGSVIFGIDTQTNNASGTQTVLGLDGSGYFSTVFGGQSPLTQSFIDSGSNAVYFNDSNITSCSNTNFTGFYCPGTSLALSATLTGNNNVTATVNFTLDNAETLGTNHPTFTVFPTIGGSFPGTTTSFDWGLPFFFGRRVANAIEAQSTAVGTGPYVAY